MEEKTEVSVLCAGLSLFDILRTVPLTPELINLLMGEVELYYPEISGIRKIDKRVIQLSEEEVLFLLDNNVTVLVNITKKERSVKLDYGDYTYEYYHEESLMYKEFINVAKKVISGEYEKMEKSIQENQLGFILGYKI